MKKTKALPRFKSDDEERAFWGKHDATDHVDFSRAKPAVFPSLKPSARTISIRLPASLLDALKVLANKRDVPYQSLMKLLLADALERERVKPTAGTRPAHRAKRQSRGVS